MPALGKRGELMEWTKVRVMGAQDQGKVRHSSLDKTKNHTKN